MPHSSVLYRLPYGMIVLLAVGCEPLTYSLPTPKPASPTIVNTQFEPQRCGTIVGRVAWSGEVPQVPSHNAYGPRINNGAVASAVVFLRKVDATKAKPWEHPAVKVTLNEQTLLVEQGSAQSTVGFVRVGDAITLASITSKIGGIHGRGASFFTHLFPPNSLPISKTLTQIGVVTLSSASRQSWANATLFVSDHPYFASTSFEGRFELRDVPSGEYELVVWHGNWQILGLDRDPESGIPSRRYYGKPLELSRTVRVTARETLDLAFTLPPQ